MPQVMRHPRLARLFKMLIHRRENIPSPRPRPRHLLDNLQRSHDRLPRLHLLIRGLAIHRKRPRIIRKISPIDRPKIQNIQLALPRLMIPPRRSPARCTSKIIPQQFRQRLPRLQHRRRIQLRKKPSALALPAQ